MCIPGTSLSRYINFYTEFVFKKIFGTEANKDLLISFLNGLFDLQGDDAIEDVTYLNTEQLGENIQERRAIYDVYCKTNRGDRFITEMFNRFICYKSVLFSENVSSHYQPYCLNRVRSLLSCPNEKRYGNEENQRVLLQESDKALHDEPSYTNK